MIGILMSMFVCSFSSILSAMVLIFFSISIMGVMYWNMMTVIPIYLFSLFMLGGLFVMIGFMMMADTRDMDSISDSNKTSKFVFFIFMSTMMILCSIFLSENKNLDSFENSYFKEESLEASFQLSSSYLFMILFLFLFLFFLFMLMKSSSTGSFVKK